MNEKKDGIVISINGTYAWSFVTKILVTCLKPNEQLFSYIVA
jgi:hypothetical protein